MSREAARRLRVGVLGVGRIGSMHAELLAHRISGATLAGVFDVDGERAARAGSMFGVPSFRDAREMLHSASLDAVAICTSTDTHVDLIVAAAESCKPMLCEKPLSLELAEIDRALAAVERAGVPLQVGFNRRFDPAHQAVRDAVAAGEIGEAHLVRISSRDPEPPPLEYVQRSGGIYLDMTIHDFDMARYVTGSEVVDVHARGAVRIDPAIGEAGDVDTAAVSLVHENGVLTLIDNSRRAVYGFDQRVEVFGSAGVVASENPLAHTTVRRTAEGAHAAALPHFFLERYTPSYVRAWEAFVETVHSGRPAPVDGRDGRTALAIALAAQRSLDERRTVRVAEIG